MSTTTIFCSLRAKETSVGFPTPPSKSSFLVTNISTNVNLSSDGLVEKIKFVFFEEKEFEIRKVIILSGTFWSFVHHDSEANSDTGKRIVEYPVASGASWLRLSWIEDGRLAPTCFFAYQFGHRCFLEGWSKHECFFPKNTAFLSNFVNFPKLNYIWLFLKVSIEVEKTFLRENQLNRMLK